MKTKKFLSMAALALVGAMMTGCSNDDNYQQPENKNNVVTLTTTVSLDGGATTRALTAGGVKTFAVGETMAIYYWKNKGNDHVKAVSAPLTAGDITNGGKSATFTFTLDNPYKDQRVSYVYPAAMANADFTPNYDALYNNQDGTLATLASNFDYCTRSGDWNGDNLPSLTLENQLAILDITLKDEAGANDITGSITGLTLSDGTYSYSVTRSAAAGPIYVAIRPTSSANIDITATDGTKNYTKTLTSKTYAASNGYPVSWKMTEAAPAYTMAASATASDKDKLICTDGHIHAYGEDAACTKNRVAKIIYVGTTGDATYSHGLALALADEELMMNWETAKTACSNKNTSTPVTDATWLLASKEQWDYMIGEDDADGFENLRDGFNSVGGTNLEQSYYWSSTEDNDDSSLARIFRFDIDEWTYEDKGTDDSVNTRACLAF